MLKPSISGTLCFTENGDVQLEKKCNIQVCVCSRGQSPMHVLGQYGKENAAAIFELFLECMPEYPLDKPDNEGNTGTIVLHVFIYLFSLSVTGDS